MKLREMVNGAYKIMAIYVPLTLASCSPNIPIPDFIVSRSGGEIGYSNVTEGFQCIFVDKTNYETYETDYGIDDIVEIGHWDVGGRGSDFLRRGDQRVYDKDPESGKVLTFGQIFQMRLKREGSDCLRLKAAVDTNLKESGIKLEDLHTITFNNRISLDGNTKIILKDKIYTIRFSP